MAQPAEANPTSSEYCRDEVITAATLELMRIVHDDRFGPFPSELLIALLGVVGLLARGGVTAQPESRDIVLAAIDRLRAYVAGGLAPAPSAGEPWH